MALVDGKYAERVRYKLYGVLYHHGESASSGHYSVDVVNPNEDSSSWSGEAWLHIDDEAVSPVRHEDVFWGHENDRGDNRCAYILFYSRMDSAQTSSVRSGSPSIRTIPEYWPESLPMTSKKSSWARRLTSLHKKFK